MLSKLFRRLFLEALEKAYAQGQLQFFGDLEPLRDPLAFARYLAPLRQSKWVVYAKAPFGGPQRVLEYLGRYTHRVAISNSRLLKLEDGLVSFAWKDYRAQRAPQGARTTTQGDDRLGRGVHPPLPVTRPAAGLPTHPLLRLSGNCHRAEMVALCRRLSAIPHPICSHGPPIYARRLRHGPAQRSGSVRSAGSESSPGSWFRRPGAARIPTPHDAHPPQPATAPALPLWQGTLPVRLPVPESSDAPLVCGAATDRCTVADQQLWQPSSSQPKNHPEIFYPVSTTQAAAKQNP